MLITMLYIMQHISKLPHYYSVVPKEIINFATFLNQNRKNMKAFVFPGQGAQFVGMGKDLYENSALAKELFEKANDILGYRITDIMFEGTDEDLRQTKVTQPAVFLHSVISALCMGDDFKPEMTAGHSLGEFSALVAAGALSFEDGLKLVYARAMAMQKACEAQPSTMAAIIALPDEKVEEICEAISKEGEVVVAANYNCPGQIVISGSIEGINKACEQMKAAGAKRALPLKVGGAFHSPLMNPAKVELEAAINATEIHTPKCPGFAHLGIMQALHEHGIRPEILSGVSAGALAAVFYADGKEPYHIVELFEHHSFKELTTFSINKQGLLKLDSFIDFLNSNLESKTIEELKIPTIITATDLDHGRIVSFKKGKIAERLAASCCMPILFAPIRINNTYYVDGGILMNLPVSPIRKECEKVIALNVDPLVADEYSKNVVSIALRAYHFIFQANTLPQKGIADLLIESYGLEEYSNRELERAEEIFEKGYNTATELLDRLLLENGTIWR